MCRPLRRRYLTGIAAVASTTLAGCSFTDSSDPTTTQPRYEYLKQTAVFVADTVSLTLPEVISIASTPGDAALVVLPATTDVEPSTAIDWLTADKAVALLGSAAESTLASWRDSDAYREAFGGEGGSADPEPDPELVVAYVRDGESLSTHNATWGHTDDPSDEAVLGALEDSLRYRAEGVDA